MFKQKLSARCSLCPRLCCHVAVFLSPGSTFVANPDPVLFEDLEKLPINEQNLWQNAINVKCFVLIQEMKSLNQNKVSGHVELPENEKTMSCKWVFRIK